jgi:hypothetical protein
VTPPQAPFAAEVARYLADCAEHAGLLSPACHPTEDGALKLIYHRGKDQAGQVRAAFRAAVAARPPAGRRRLSAAPSPAMEGQEAFPKEAPPS